MTELFAGHTPTATSPQGRFAAGAARISGEQAGIAHAWGKHLFWPFTVPHAELGDDGPLWLHVHLGLYGSWTFDGDETFVATRSIGAPRKVGEAETERDLATDWVPAPPKGAVRLRLATAHGNADLTGPAKCDLLTGAEVRTILDRLGPDPLRNEPGDRERFITSVRKRKVPVGQLVLDQKVVAGPGNIYRADCLFRTGINPMRLGVNVSATRLGHLWDDLVVAMGEGRATGIIDTNPREFVDPAADETDQRFAVYHRTGRPCHRCGTPISQADMAGRNLFWCPSCQR